jgi:hypothetical protein
MELSVRGSDMAFQGFIAVKGPVTVVQAGVYTTVDAKLVLKPVMAILKEVIRVIANLECAMIWPQI